MTTVAISQLPAATTATAADEIPIVQGGTTKKLTNAQLFAARHRCYDINRNRQRSLVCRPDAYYADARRRNGYVR